MSMGQLFWLTNRVDTLLQAWGKFSGGLARMGAAFSGEFVNTK